MQRLSVREGEVRQKRTQVQLKTRNCRNDEGRNSTRGRQTKAECVHNLGCICPVHTETRRGNRTQGWRTYEAKVIPYSCRRDQWHFSNRSTTATHSLRIPSRRLRSCWQKARRFSWDIRGAAGICEWAHRS